MRVLPLRHWLETRLARREWLHPAAWLGLFLGLEVLGRRSRSDAQDAIGVACVLAFTALTVLDHRRRQPVVMVDWLRERLSEFARRLGAWKIETGLDLRETPPLPRRVPGWLRRLCLGSLAILTVLALVRSQLPEGLRSLAIQISPSIWFTFLAVLWTWLVLGSFALLAVPLPHLHDRLQSSDLWAKRPSWMSEFVLVGTYLAGVAAIALICPAWVALAIATVSFVTPVTILMLPGNPRLAFCWRPKKEPIGSLGGPNDGFRPVYSVDWTEAIQGPAVTMMCVLFSAILLARGSQLHDLVPSSMPVTTTLGWIFSWAVAAGALAEARVKASALLAARFRDPARRCPVHVALQRSGTTREAQRSSERLAQALAKRKRGEFNLEARVRSLSAVEAEREGAGSAGPPEVQLCIDENASSDDWRWSGTWPLRVSTKDLDRPELAERIVRREEILCRRRLFRGLERLFKLASRKRYENGSGFWVCPHLWAIAGLHRDVDEETTWSIGPAFHRVMPLAARAHLHRVLRGLEIDLLFVEDGVGFRRMKRVFAMMFEVHDIFGGEKRGEEAHFSGLPGVRVLIHELDFDRPFQRKGYPEPDYQEIGRARILHVFQDRGGESELDPTPRIPDVLYPDDVPDFAPVLS